MARIAVMPPTRLQEMQILNQQIVGRPSSRMRGSHVSSDFRPCLRTEEPAFPLLSSSSFGHCTILEQLVEIKGVFSSADARVMLLGSSRHM